MNFHVFTLWTDKMFYIYSAAGAGAVVFLIYAIRRWLELANEPHYGYEPEGEAAPIQTEAETVPEPDSGTLSRVAALEEALPPEPEAAPEAQPPLPEPGGEQTAPPAAAAPGAEAFVRGLYENLASFDARLGAVENAIGNRRGSRRFIISQLEEMLRDYDSLSLVKIKGRLVHLTEELNGAGSAPEDREE